VLYYLVEAFRTHTSSTPDASPPQVSLLPLQNAPVIAVGAGDDLGEFWVLG